MITIINLNGVRFQEPLISDVLYGKMVEVLSSGKKVLLLLNKKGAMSTLMCRDCSWIARCAGCDQMMRVHRNPDNFLLCHYCGVKKELPQCCPKCRSYNLFQSGARVQSIATSIQKLFPDNKSFLFDDFAGLSAKKLASYDIYIGTSKISTVPIENLGLSAFLLLESDLMIPDYDMEEYLYQQIRQLYFRSETVILQTRNPKIALIQDVTEGNFKSFFTKTLVERKKFSLPPYSQMVNIQFWDEQEKTVKTRAEKLASGLMQGQKEGERNVYFDQYTLDRRGGKYGQNILVKHPNIVDFLKPFRQELIRGRGIIVEWL